MNEELLYPFKKVLMPRQNLSEFQKKMLAWFSSIERELPWRKEYLPYEIWISEIMLQQTRVSTVIPYFQRWMKALPTITTVAEATEETLMKLWEGLGYYTRVRNIQKTAQVIVEEYGAEFPQDHANLLALPGIGAYTAGAIASIAFEQDRPIVDGNVIRIISRIENIPDSPKKSFIQKQIWEFAESWIPRGQARNFNQAMMELGAMICTPKNPQCLLCPVREDCVAYDAGTVEQRPIKEKKTPPKRRTTALAFIQKGEQFMIQKQTKKGLMQGLWELPNYSIDAKLQKTESLENRLCEMLQLKYQLQLQLGKEIARFPYMYTNFKVDVICFYYSLSEQYVSEPQEYQHWITFEKIEEYAFSSLYSKLWKKLAINQ